MISRFDHAVIAVSDVDSAIEAYAALGFDVMAGGRHPSIGTANAIVRFGLDYLELLAVEDLAVAKNAGPFGAELADFLSHSSGLVGFVLASADLDATSAGLKQISQDHNGPFAMDRERPDGRLLAWRLVIPGGSPWRKPWPFLIEWETPDSERLAWDAPGQHRNGVTGVAGIDVLVDDLNTARRFYEQGLGLSASSSDTVTATYSIGQFKLTVQQAVSVEQKSELAELGPGPSHLYLSAPAAEVQQFEPASALGARISLVANEA